MMFCVRFLIFLGWFVVMYHFARGFVANLGVTFVDDWVFLASMVVGNEKD